MSHDFKINEYDKCVYVERTPHGDVLVCLYIDNILIFGSNTHILIELPKIC